MHIRRPLRIMPSIPLLLLQLLGGSTPTRGLEAWTTLDITCSAIANAVSGASEVFYPGTTSYAFDIGHWSVTSEQNATCSVEPGTAADVGTILRILSSSRTPFAVKGGGHATNPGFSSTAGVQISMIRFSGVTYNETSQTADVGSGLIWDDVYAALEPFGVNVVGGRVTGIGVAGFTLGGGYSWLTNEHGLALDNVVAYELVLPNGTVTNVDSSTPELLFALKGGFNNFGIVTRFTLKTYPQGQVWGGTITFAADVLDEVSAATAKFSNEVTDPKAQIITTYVYVLGEPGVSQSLFYNGATPPPGIFDDFLAIPSSAADVGTRSFLSLVQSAPSNGTAGTRGYFHTVSLLSYTPRILDAILNETVFRGNENITSAFLISYAVEPFLPTIFSFAPESSSAYPPSRARALLPLNLYFAWTSPESDNIMRENLVASVDQLTKFAEEEGQDVGDAALYPNYALFGTPLERIYGDKLPVMRALKAKYDPGNVMGLAGGWKV